MPPDTTDPNAPASPDLAASPETPAGGKQRLPILNKGLSLYYVLLAVLVIVGAAVALHFHKATSNSNLQSAQVSITNTQFSPATIEVRVGTAVTWTNADTQEHQVAADPYPKDTSIAGFDNKLVLKPHDTTSFTFEKKGTYTYHDEKNPFALKGTVIVK